MFFCYIRSAHSNHFETIFNNMDSKKRKAFGPNREDYGYEWPVDPFDRYIDHLLAGKNNLHSAVDFGCGYGRRAKSLAELEIFKRIIACDVGDHTKDFVAHNLLCALARLTRCKAKTPIRFLQASVSEISPSVFNDGAVDYIQFRNVAHFLTPPQLRQALTTIRDIAASEGLIGMSFNAAPEPVPDNKIFSIYDDSDHPLLSQRKPEKSFWAFYRAEDITTYMETLGFQVSVVEITGGRYEETHIIAVAPKKQKQDQFPAVL